MLGYVWSDAQPVSSSRSRNDQNQRPSGVFRLGDSGSNRLPRIADIPPFLGIRKSCVFFVGQVIGGDMVQSKGEALSKRSIPIEKRLTGDREH